MLGQVRAPQRRVDKSAHFESDFRRVRSECNSYRDRFVQLDKTAQRRLEASRLLKQASLADFPPMLDEAVVRGVLRIEKGDKHIQALMLESTARALLTTSMNNFRYSPELARFFCGGSAAAIGQGRVGAAARAHGAVRRLTCTGGQSGHTL